MNGVIKLDIPQGYEYYGIEFDSGKILLRKKPIEFPKDYDSCCKMLNIINSGMPCIMASHLGHSISNFAKLTVARDAYWKVYAENEGLDKPWQPDWANTNEQKYSIYCVANELKIQPSCELQHVLAFPTREMCSAFYNNFKTLIESCKDLI
jgi:hypothetical protein